MGDLNPPLKDTGVIKRKLDTTRLATGTKVGQYLIQNEIDRGGMAIVYKAKQLGLDRDVALKVLPPSISIQGKFIERFQKEARSIAQLDHPNIVKIIEVGGDAGIYYIAMEYVDGLNLYKYMIRYEPTVYTVVQIIKQLASALEYAHDRNIIHRDLKLNNVIMKDNANPTLIDFGLAKAREADSGLTISGEILGSPSYMSPEQALGTHVDERTDVYSLGIMFYELLTSKNPFYDKRGYQQTIWNVLHAEVRPPRKVSDWIPKDIEVIVLKALEKETEKRYQTMRAFRLDLERFETGEPIMARPPRMFERIYRRIKKSRGLFTFVMVILFLLSMFGVYYSYQMSLETADWGEIQVKPEFYTQLDGEWTGERGTGEALKFITMDSPWMGGPGKLTVSSEEYTWIRWKRILHSDVRLEFDLTVTRESNREFGCFIHGPRPDRAYVFGFRRDGVYLGKEGRGNILNLAAIRPLRKGDRIRVRIEKNDILLRLFLDGRLRLEYSDFTPLSGLDSNCLGFFVDNAGVTLSHVDIYELGVAMKVRPIQTAERFFDRGYYKEAIEEYRMLIAQYPNKPMAARAQFKIGLSYLRLGELEKAVTEFENILRTREEEMFPQAMAQMADCYRGMQDPYRSEKTLLQIRDRYPGSSALIGLLSAAQSRVLSDMDRGDSASLARADAELKFLAKNFKSYASFFAGPYLHYGEFYLAQNRMLEAQDVFRTVEKEFGNQVEEGVLATVRLADIEACLGAFEQSIARYNKIMLGSRLSPRVTAECWLGLGLVNRALGKTEDAVQCYNVVINEYPYLRELCVRAVLNCALAYAEKSSGDPVADELFRKIIARYRDRDEELWTARLMVGEAAPEDAARKINGPMFEYYIAEKYRKDHDFVNALSHFEKFRRKMQGNQVYLRLAENQMEQVRLR